MDTTQVEKTYLRRWKLNSELAWLFLMIRPIQFHHFASTIHQLIKQILINQLRCISNQLQSQRFKFIKNMEELNQSLFFALSRQDFQTAEKFLDAGANPNAIFALEKNHYISSFCLFITKSASVGSTKGPNNNQYKACMNLIKKFIKKSTLECKCLKDHKCPLYIALEAFKITNQDQILQHKCDLIRYLVINGATIKYELKQDTKANKSLNKWSLRWFDIDGIKNYLITKNFKFVETKLEEEKK